MMKTYEWPNPEEIEALKDWAMLHGRNWKSQLREAWMTGDYQGFEKDWLLQPVRNTLGPSWLSNYRLDKDKATGRIMWSVQEPRHAE